MVDAMHSMPAEKLDALCHRRCAFALYCLPGAQEPVFCMAEDGRTEDDPIFKNGFLFATFEGSSLFIPDELSEVPEAEQWEELEFIPQEAATPRGKYAALFEHYTGLIKSGQLRKIVLARTADVPVEQSFSPARAFEAACRQNPAAFKALVHTPQYGTWLFCTPEQLVTGSGEHWHTMALAGRDGGKIGQLAEVAVIAPEQETYLIQEYHLAIYHLLCAMVEYELFEQ
jgi:isochorismate synthase EntC